MFVERLATMTRPPRGRMCDRSTRKAATAHFTAGMRSVVVEYYKNSSTTWLLNRGRRPHSVVDARTLADRSVVHRLPEL